jgi:uncharacterized linocin/CFP29 family protein
MSADHLLRGLAPVTDALWEQIDEEARSRLLPGLAARRLVDFEGPLGWQHAAVTLGRVTPVGGLDGEGIEALQRRVLPLTELRAPFIVSRDELRAGERGAPDVDFADLDRAAAALVAAENAAVFHGWQEADIEGIADSSPHEPIRLAEGVQSYPAVVARAVERLLRDGIGGPYGMALGREEWTEVVETTERGGVILRDHLEQILGGPLCWSPGVRGAVVLSLRGGDFLFTSGQDLSVGYAAHDAEAVELYLEESFAFRVATPEAAVAVV